MKYKLTTSNSSSITESLNISEDRAEYIKQLVASTAASSVASMTDDTDKSFTVLGEKCIRELNTNNVNEVFYVSFLIGNLMNSISKVYTIKVQLELLLDEVENAESPEQAATAMMKYITLSSKLDEVYKNQGTNNSDPTSIDPSTSVLSLLK